MEQKELTRRGDAAFEAGEEAVHVIFGAAVGIIWATPINFPN
jgi:hypothetical protein